MKNITELRDNAIETLLKLQRKEISCDEAGVTGKLYENVISTLKTQLEYNKMLKKETIIPYLEECQPLLYNESFKRIGGTND